MDCNEEGTPKMPPVPPAKPDLPVPKFVDSLWCVYAVSVVAAWNAEFLTYPLDLIKTRLQIQGELNKNGNKVPYRGMLGTALGITKEEGLHKLWQGVHAAFARHLIYSGTRIMTYKALKEKLFKQTNNDDYFPLWKSALCGVSAGALAQYIASPTDLVKVQLQMEGRRRLMGLPPRVHGICDAFKKVWASGGVRGLWKGSVPNVQRAALVNLGDLTTYDLLKRSILHHTSLPDSHLVHVLASCGAGFVAASMGTPADVIKTRVMNQPLDDRGRFLLSVPIKIPRKNKSE
ncbi:mitochondrial uncoupling protein 4 isoform X2 [Anthonomus grandis grandis]|uniref:mitochondrial uncoupling protein 4 isoform X2 n=1 Tax=Anthonomus grandis grandis TaxID=2921223 RepID=UPI002165982D|nr:mitochondrial uncoupling protein 4 isoform X2 [Anthonomus grandis grandis]